MNLRTTLAMVMAAGCSAGLASSARALPPFTIRPLVLEGDAIGSAIVSDISKVAVNNSGDWVVLANQVSTTQPELIIRNGQAIFREGDSLAGPFGPTNIRTIASTGADIANTGRSAWTFPLTDPFNFAQSALLLGTRIVGFSDQVAYQDAHFATWSQFLGAKLNDADRMLVLANVDDFSVSGTSNRVVARVDVPAGGGAATTTRLHLQGDVLPGQSQAMDSTSTLDHQFALNNRGDYAFLALLQGTTAGELAVNEALYLNGSVLLAQKGRPGPVAGTTWGALSGNGSAVALGDRGDVVLRGTLSAAPPLHQVILKNGGAYIRSGDPAPGVPGRSLIALSFGETPVRTDDAGDVLFYGKWNEPILSRNTGLFFNRELLLQTGVTAIGGQTLAALASGPGSFDMSGNGRFVVFVGQIPNRPGATGPTDGAFLIEFQLCAADYNADGVLDPDDLADYIACYFSLPPCGRADRNADGTADPDDLADFITAYFGAC